MTIQTAISSLPNISSRIIPITMGTDRAIIRKVRLTAAMVGFRRLMIPLDNLLHLISVVDLLLVIREVTASNKATRIPMLTLARDISNSSMTIKADTLDRAGALVHLPLEDGASRQLMCK